MRMMRFAFEGHCSVLHSSAVFTSSYGGGYA